MISDLGGPLITQTALAGAQFDFDVNSRSKADIFDLLITVEQTGVGAYLGAIPLFRTFRFLQAAAAIEGTEARHTAALIVIRNEEQGRTDLPAPRFNEGFQNAGIDVPLDPNTVLARVSPFIVFPSNNS